MNKSAIDHEGICFSIEVSDCSNSWGNGIKVSIYKPNSDFLNSISYLCHPEFEKYDEFQLKSLEEIEILALARLKNDMSTTDFKLASEHGIGLLLSIKNEKT